MRSPTPAPRLAALLLSALALAPLGLSRNAPAPQAPEPGPGPELAHSAPFHDCNANGVEDAVDIALGTSSDVDLDGVPDECQSWVEAPADAGGGGTGVSGHES